MTTSMLAEQAVQASPNLAELPEEFLEHYEIVNGQIVEEPPLGARESWIASIIDQILGAFARSHRLGRVITEGLFVLQQSPRFRRRPDVAFVSAERWPLDRPIPAGAAWDVIPDLVIEVISPTDLASEVQGKVLEYLRFGVRQVWVVYVTQAQLMIYRSSTDIQVFHRADTIDCGSLLPGLRVPLVDVFETEADESSIPSD